MEKEQTQKYIKSLTLSALDVLEGFEGLNSTEILLAESDISEIAEHVESIQETIAGFKPSTGKDYECITGHEMGVCPGRV